ncbi:hypothetical protein B0H15DRAFT_780823 [Mycena belliarum]|uniref:Uncharacterized protein n=1 Tax=Mycena belliarum TaxID=1033014 RepID=A0AAD6U519_9AGAR|nr:hypothetical protein B0H15DRAFT_780823 [Mycena belliae]
MLQHLQTAQSRNSDVDKANDDEPVIPFTPSPQRDFDVHHQRSQPAHLSRFEPPRRSSRLAAPQDSRVTRAARRASEQAVLGTRLKSVVRKHVTNAAPVHITTTPDDYPVTSTGWGGIREKPVQPRTYSLEELQQDFGMKIVDWDGRSSRPLVDRESRIIGVLGGRPNDAGYLDLTREAARQLEAQRENIKMHPGKAEGRRGTFTSASYGISFGGGQQIPGNLKQSPATTHVINMLFLMQCFIRIAGFGNGLFKAWNPEVHAFYEFTLDALTNQYNPNLRRNFQQKVSAFAAATLNFGPSTVTLPHIDCLNLAWGWCAITALGLFDPDLGGHLVLWDLKLIIRFPPGSTILIPSAILRHSNIGIQLGETRYSFTQFTAAGLFRWVDNGFKSDLTAVAETQADPEAQAARARARQTRWSDGIESFKRWKGPRAA